MKKILALALFALIATADVSAGCLDRIMGTKGQVAQAAKDARYNQKSHLGKHYGKYAAGLMLATTLVAGYVNRDEKEWSEQSKLSMIPYLFMNGVYSIGSGAKAVFNAIAPERLTGVKAAQAAQDKAVQAAAKVAAQAAQDAIRKNAAKLAGDAYDKLWLGDVLRHRMSRDAYILKYAPKFMPVK